MLKFCVTAYAEFSMADLSFVGLLSFVPSLKQLLYVSQLTSIWPSPPISCTVVNSTQCTDTGRDDMRQATYAAAAAVLMTLTLGCNPRDRRETASTIDSAATDVSQETREAARDVREEVGDYTYERRQEFKRDVDERIQRLDQEIAELERDTKKGVDRARDSAVVNIRAIRRSLDRSLDRLGAATANTWDEVKSGVSRAVDSLDLVVRGTRSDAKPMGGAGSN